MSPPSIDINTRRRNRYSLRRVVFRIQREHTGWTNSHVIDVTSPVADQSQLQSGDAVIIPAFGTEVGTRKKLEAKGLRSWWTPPAAT